MTYGWVSYTSQFLTLIVTNIDTLNFLNFLIGAVVEDCGVFLPQFSVMALKEKLFPIIGDTSLKKNENIFNSK